jgi:hypothetical protein
METEPPIATDGFKKIEMFFMLWKHHLGYLNLGWNANFT